MLSYGARSKDYGKILEKKVVSFDEFWTIPNVNYEGKVSSWDLLKKLMPSVNFDETVNQTKRAKEENYFYTESIKFYYSLFKTLYDSEEENVEEIRNFLNKSMNGTWLNTTTLINYKKSGKDQIIHNYSLPNQEKINQKFVGVDEIVKNSKNKDFYKNLLGSENVKKINEVFQWITGKQLRLWRFNYEMTNDKISIARMDSNLKYSNLCCDNENPDYDVASLGVRLSANKR